MTFLSLVGGHLTFEFGSLNHPKQVTSRIARKVIVARFPLVNYIWGWGRDRLKFAQLLIGICRAYDLWNCCHILKSAEPYDHRMKWTAIQTHWLLEEFVGVPKTYPQKTSEIYGKWLEVPQHPMSSSVQASHFCQRHNNLIPCQLHSLKLTYP